MPTALASALAEAVGPVLLVDDFTETGWTLAVAARTLRRAGAQGVLPLVLAVQADCRVAPHIRRPPPRTASVPTVYEREMNGRLTRRDATPWVGI